MHQYHINLSIVTWVETRTDGKQTDKQIEFNTFQLCLKMIIKMRESYKIVKCVIFSELQLTI